ncbi:PREDICTED: uncharacterized protein LOC108756151 isoform X3 [Trachymyrmex septentrionalis]|uniref:uncharacterized protein LOC108756151 isoform X3 n=1 Tax=Trachymyrmex septentrionalis TaxID=34720 RepID=UPI00084F80F6|nr:PREDICTED: uncharacterized protein LOC108756151 isoform X3 [Trachymyrmex septentrionalis]
MFIQSYCIQLKLLKKWNGIFFEIRKIYRFLHVVSRFMNVMPPLDLNKLKKRPLTKEVLEQPKKKIDRFDGLSEEEVQKYTLQDYLEMNLDLIFVGINPSLMAAHRGLKKYLHFLKGEITNVDLKEFCFEGRKQIIPSTSKMWRRKNVSTFLHGGRVVNKNTLCLDTSEEDIGSIRTVEFLVEKSDQKYYKDENTSFNKKICSQKIESRETFDETVEKLEFFHDHIVGLR